MVTGFFNTSIQLATTPLYSVGGADIFLAEFNSGGGTAKWSAGYGAPRTTPARLWRWTPAKRSSWSVGWGAPASLGGATAMVPATGSAEDGFIAKYDGTATNTLQWAKTFGGTVGVTPNQCGVAADADGNVVLAGASLGPVNLGGSTLTPAGANPNVYLGKLDATGGHDWSKMFGDANGQVSPVVTTDPTTRDVVLAFGNNGTVDLGTTMVVFKPSESSLVVARLHP